MLAIVAAVVLGLALILDLANVTIGGNIEIMTLVILALLLMALHMGGIGSGWSGRTGGWYRNRRRGRSRV
jgi:thiamine transporter ThiT